MFSQIIAKALSTTSITDLEKELSSFHLDIIENTPPFHTPASKLAAQGEHEAVKRLRKLGANASKIAEGYAIAGNDEKVKQYLEHYFANPKHVIQGYAFAGNEEKVKEYLEQYKIPPGIAIFGYTAARYFHTAYKFYEQYGSRVINYYAAGAAVAGKDDVVEHLKNFKEADINFILQAYALVGRHDKVQQYQNSPGAQIESLIIGYVLGGFHEQIAPYRGQYRDTIASYYAKAGNHVMVQQYLNEGADPNKIAYSYAAAGYDMEVEKIFNKYKLQPEIATFIALGYASVGNHQKVNEYQVKHGANVHEIARAYAIAEYHEKVEEYRINHNADVEEITAGYIIAGLHAKVDEYRIKHNASPHFIAYYYAVLGQAQKAEEYRIHHNADPNVIADGYAEAGDYKQVMIYRMSHQAKGLYAQTFALEQTMQLLQEHGKLGESLINVLKRLKNGKENTWNPYWTKSSKKLDEVIDAIYLSKNLSSDIKDSNSLLYKALNMQRISAGSFFHKKAKSLLAVEESGQSMSLK